MKIYNVNKGKNRFCGPAVISALTKMDTDDAARLIRYFSGKRQTTGTSTGSMAKSLAKCGIIMRSTYNRSRKPSNQRMTLTQWLKDSKPFRTSGRVYLIVAGNHWQLVSGRKYVCGITEQIVSVRDKQVKRRARVSEVWELQLRDGKVKIPHHILDQMKPKSSYNPDRAKAQRIAKKYGVELEHDFDDVYSVWPPVGLFDPEIDDNPEDPFVGERMERHWDVILEKVTVYADMVQERGLQYV